MAPPQVPESLILPSTDVKMKEFAAVVAVPAGAIVRASASAWTASPPKVLANPADRRLMDLSSIALQGLAQAEAQLEAAASQIAQAGAPSAEQGNVDTVNLSAEMVALMAARNLYTENLATLKTADQIQKSVVELKE